MRVRERGMVTAEIAVSLSGLAIIMLGLVWVFGVVSAQIRCVDAARDTARALARGESVDDARAEGERTAPPGARFAVRVSEGSATVKVSVRVRPTVPVLSRLSGVLVSGRAVVSTEPGVGT
jgi:hypothetical protein